MLPLIRPALVLLALFTVLTGGLYPLAVTGIAQILFPHQANGSLIVADGRVIGSALIAQPFTDPRHFWPRPSAAGANGYDGGASSGANLGPTNAAFIKTVGERAEAYRQAGPVPSPTVPVDLVTASGSGLDPHITPAGALYQVPRVAAARGVPEDRMRALVMAQVERRTFGVLGEPRVNVLRLNLAVDAAFGPVGGAPQASAGSSP